MGSAAVITLLKNEVMVGWYAIGLVIGFLASFAIGLGLNGKQGLQLRLLPLSKLTPCCR